MTTFNLALTQNPSNYGQPQLKSLPLREQPAYRVAQNASACNLSELLAAVIGGPKQIELAQAVLTRFNGDVRCLYQAHPAELSTIKGIHQATAVRIKAALNLGLRLNAPNDERPIINSPGDAAQLVQNEMSLLEEEHLRTLLLDTKNHLLDIVDVYKGSVNMSQVRVGEVFKAAIRRNATAIIVVHSHPSGDPTPSPEDIAVTRAIVQAGKLLDCQLLDHLIIGTGRWVSLKERGLGFT